MKLVINTCFGGFGLSEQALAIMGVEDFDHWDDASRTDKHLIEAVETLGAAASDEFAELTIVEITDKATDYFINDYDGLETVFYVVDGKIHRI